MKKILIALAIILLSLGALLFSMKCLDWTLMKAIGFAGMVMCLAMTVWTHYTWGWIETNKHCFSYWFAFRDMDKWPNAKGWKWGGLASMAGFGAFMFLFLCHVLQHHADILVFQRVDAAEICFVIHKAGAGAAFVQMHSQLSAQAYVLGVAAADHRPELIEPLVYDLSGTVAQLRTG